MRELFKLIHLVAPYLVTPILLAGIFKWKHLSTPFRIFIIGAALSTIISLIKAQVKDSNIGFFLSALLGVTVYGFLLKSILTNIINVKIIWIGVVLIWIIIGWYSIHNGVTDFQLRIIIPFDLFMIIFCGIYVVDCLRKLKRINSPVFFLVLYLLMEFCVNLFLDMVSNFLYAYFSNSFMTLLWKEILPVYTILKVIVIVWIILSVKPKLPSLDKMPSF